MSGNNGNQNKINENASLQQLQQKAWVKDQEVNALKVQNRHLISKLEEAEKKFQPGQVYSQQIAAEVQNYLKPVIGQIDKSLSQAFELVQGTLRGVYQQSQRAQGAVDDLTSHIREFEMKMIEQRKADQVYFQEKIFATVTAFCDRLERQIENRMSALSSVELMNIKQNEVLTDIEKLKSTVNVTNQKLSELKNVLTNRNEIEAIAPIEHAQPFTTTTNSSRDAAKAANEVFANALSAEFANRSENKSNSNEIKNKEDDIMVVLELIRAQKEEQRRMEQESKTFLKTASISENEIQENAEESILEVEGVDFNENNESNPEQENDSDIHSRY